jgi:cbb3-type cytochrome oxidase subunit 1
MTLSTTEVLQRIVGPVNIASGTSTVFTGTTAHRYTIKKMTVLNSTAGAITYTMGVGGVAAANLILPSVTLQAGEWTQFDGMENLSGTETLQMTASATGGTLTVNGLDQS